MVYGREYGDRELEFEASGALLKGSLVMRDRQTDSWWSIMTSDAIGGSLAGAELAELPYGEKATWGDWVARHPDTLVLSVDGREHDEHNPYAGYFAGADTFRDLEVADDRLPAKAPVFTFHLDGRAWAVPHHSFEGGALFRPPGLDGRGILLHRAEGAPIFASSDAWLVPAGAADDAGELLQGTAELEPLPGFDTYWYTWVSVNEATELITGG